MPTPATPTSPSSPRRARSDPPSAALVDVDGIAKSFPQRGGGTVRAVVEVSFTARRGEVVGLLGPNGAGKSTSIKMICGLVRPDAGRVRVAGHDVLRERGRALRHLAAVLEGNRNLYWRLTARENLRYFAGNRGVAPARVADRIEALLERFGLGGKGDQIVGSLSRGMQQKLAIAVAVLADADVVLLDEPTLGLDVGTGDEVRALLAEIAAEGRTVILSTHDMAVVQDVCERAVIVAGGRVLADAPVGDLRALFATRGWSVALDAPADARLLAALRARFVAVSGDPGDARIEVDAGPGDDLYALVDALRRCGALPTAVSRTEVHFEEVFRRVIRGERPDARPVVPAEAGR